MSTPTTQDSTASSSLNPARISIVGAGKVGEAMIEAILKANFYPLENIRITTRTEKRAQQLHGLFGVQAITNEEAAETSDVILLCVKPQKAEEVLTQMALSLRPECLIISIMAGITLAQLERWAQVACPVIRSMPNTPLRIQKGMTALAGGTHTEARHLSFSKAMFDTMGRTRIIDEKLFDAVTGLSASGPAFIYIMIESLAEGGVKAGLPRNVAIELAAQACLGASSMVLENGRHPAVLKDEVTTPAGCTIDGILKLEEGGIRVTLIKAVEEAARKAKALGEE